MKGWKKARVNFLVDSAILVSFAGLAISGFVLWLVLPSGGYQGGRGVAESAKVFVLGRETWKLLHDWLSVSMVSGVLLHVALHWNWITCMIRNMWREAWAPRATSQPEQCEI